MFSDGYHWRRPGFQRRRPNSQVSFWVITALLLSFAGHAVLWIFFGAFEMPAFAKITLTAPFNIKRSTFDATVLEDLPGSETNRPATSDEGRSQPDDTSVSAEEIAKFTEFSEDDLPAGFIVNTEIKMTPAVEQVENLALDAPGVSETGLDLASALAGDPAQDFGVELHGLPQQAKPLDPDHPHLSVGDLLQDEPAANPPAEAAGHAGGDLVPDGYLGLDELLGMKGGGDPGKPIWVPTDVLFGFNSAELREEARLSLMKLGAFIMQRKDCEFILEGHTDLIGSHDYNHALSVNRATAIRNYFIEALRLDPDRIKVIGLGKTKPLILSGTAEEQAQNRRVEVTIRPLGTRSPF